MACSFNFQFVLEYPLSRIWGWGGVFFPLLVKCFKPQLLSLSQYGNVMLEDGEEVPGEYFNS